MGSNLFGPARMTVNSFLVDGLLIDTGCPRMQRAFLNHLDISSIAQGIITHHHEDHSGNAPAILARTNVPFYASPRCVEILHHPPRVSPAQYFTWGQNKKVELNPLDLNARIETDRYSFEIIETPGHAEDMISLYEPNQGWLFSADNYASDYIAIFLDNEVMYDQIASLQKLLALDFDVLLCSHNSQFRNGKKYLRAKLDFLTNFYESVQAKAQKGMTPEQIMDAMKLKEYKTIKRYSLGKLSRINMVRSAMKPISS